MSNQHIYTFSNGYSASVLTENSPSYPATLFELAVLDSDGQLDYSTPITGDVLRYINASELLFALNAVAALPAKEMGA